MKTTIFFNQGIKIWVLAGLAGVILFAGLKDQFDFFADAPILHPKEEAVAKTETLYEKLGIQTDTLGIVPFRQQRAGLYQSMLDSLNSSVPTPSQLNRENFHLHGWDVIASTTLGLNESFNLSPGSIYEASGLYRTHFDNSGQVKHFELRKERGARSDISGTLSLETAQKIVEEVFGYDLSIYELQDISEEDTESVTGPPEEMGRQFPLYEASTGPTSFKWRAAAGVYHKFIELELDPVINQQQAISEHIEEISTVSVTRFDAYHEMEKLPSTSLNDYFVVLFISVIALLALITFIEGLGQLLKGKADWRRIFFIALAVSLGIYGWRLIFLLNFTNLLTLQANIVIQFNQLIFGLVMGFFGSIAYIGWEAYARNEKQFQIDLIDAYWRGKVYLHETGSGILKGFSLGGLMLGILALFMTFSGLYMHYSDSQFGFTEVINRPQFISINLSLFIIAGLGSLSMVGIIYNFFSKRINNRTIVFTGSVILVGLLFTGLGRSFGTNGSQWQEIMLFILLAVPLITAYKISGLMTVFTGIWFFSSVITILPYIGSPSLDVSMTGWLQLSLVAGLLIFGVLAYRKAPLLSSVTSYIPDYEKKMMRNLRFENEMQIARETQQKLMPYEQITTQDYELHGYFLPSFEVGGDYFDYIKGSGGNGEQYLTLTVVDVSGKSMRAAMQAVFTSGLLRSRMYTDQPSKILREICPVIFEKTDSRTFITCLISRFEPETKLLKLANAGHCLPILKRDGKAVFLRAPEPRFPLGMRSEVEYQQLSVQLEPGDLILFYSDGFPEAVNEKGERIGFEEARMFVESLNSTGLSAKEICNRIKEYIEEFSIDRLADDTTILCLKIK